MFIPIQFILQNFVLEFSEVISEESSNSDDAIDLIDEIVAFPLDLKEADCEDQDCSGGRPRHASSSSDGTVESVEDNILDEVTAEDLDIEKKSTKNNGNGQAAAIQSPKDTFYFYQSSDGK